MSTVGKMRADEVARLIDVLSDDLGNKHSLAVMRAQLVQFGLWSRFNFPRVCSCISIFIDSFTGSTVSTPMISDDLALTINDAIVELAASDVYSAEVVCLYYIRGLAEYEICERVGRSRHRVKALLSSGEGFVAGYVSRKRINSM